uniref:Chromosome partitioning protein n=1 Tax=uncultured Aquificia bacterium TaxID=453415 RepID=H5SBU1_9BACT|nr:chromosome partitioning protein [uncultured Aquificae bacterium]
MIVELEIKDLVVPQGLLPRVLTGTVEEKVQEYAEMLEQGVEFDPILVWKREKGYWVIDGVHRLSAHQKVGKTTIKAKLVECKDELDYRVKAIQANIKHGLALAKEEKPLLAQILYKEGLSEEEKIQKIFGVTDRTIRNWLAGVKKQEKQEKIKKALELKEQGLTTRQIAEKLGVDQSTVVKWLSGGDEKWKQFPKFIILDPEVKNQVKNPTPEGWQALSVLVQKLGVAGKPELEVCRQVLEELGFPTEQAKDLLSAFSYFVEATKKHLSKLPTEADETLARKWVNSMQELSKLEPQARRIWLERAVAWWEKEKERRIKEREKEERILEIAKKIIQHPEFLFSSWRNLAVDMKLRSSWWGLTKEEENILNMTPQGEIEEILRRHADELWELYTSIPEASEELIDGLIDILEKELSYDEFVGELRRRGYRAPLSSGLFNYYRSLLEKRAAPTSPPSVPLLAGSQPAPSTEPDWSDWGGPEWKKAESSKSKKSQKPEKGFDLNKEIDEAIELAATALAVYLTKLSPDEWEEYVWKPFTEKMMSLLESVRRRHR